MRAASPSSHEFTIETIVPFFWLFALSYFSMVASRLENYRVWELRRASNIRFFLTLPPSTTLGQMRVSFLRWMFLRLFSNSSCSDNFNYVSDWLCSLELTDYLGNFVTAGLKTMLVVRTAELSRKHLEVSVWIIGCIFSMETLQYTVQTPYAGNPCRYSWTNVSGKEMVFTCRFCFLPEPLLITRTGKIAIHEKREHRNTYSKSW